MTLYVFDTTKRDAAIAQFALDKTCDSKPLRIGSVQITPNPVGANDLAAFLREFFDAPTSAKLQAHQMGSAKGISGDTPEHPLPPRETP